MSLYRCSRIPEEEPVSHSRSERRPEFRRKNDAFWQAMEEGVKGSRAFIAIVTGPCVNPDAPDDEPITNAYFKREYCIKVRAKLRTRGVQRGWCAGARVLGIFSAL